MKVTLEKIRLGSASLSDRIYAGVLTQDKRTWLHKIDVTSDFFAAAIARWNGFSEVIQDGNGKKYQITVIEIE